MSRPTCLTCPYWDATDAVRQNVATAKNVYYIANCIRFPAPGVRKQAGETCGEHNQFPAYVAGFKPPTVP